MNEYVDLDMKNIMKYIEHIFDIEEDFEWIFDLLSLENIVGGANRVLQEERIIYRFSHVPSLLDFVPMDRFDEVVENIGLTPEKNGKLYYDTVKYHNDVHTGTNLADRFAELKDMGINIGYIVGSGYTALSSVGTNSDFLIDIYLASGGATCALFGEKFEDGYVQNGLICNDPAHYHISPEFNIDASTGALPDNTWYVTGQGHGQYFNDPYTREIVCEFLWGGLKTVYDDERFPQFNYSQKHADNVYAYFNNTDAGYHSTADTEFVVENLSNTSPLHIWSVEINGADMDYCHKIDTVLQVGEKYVMDISNATPETADKPFTVSVSYIIDNTMKTVATREFSFIAVSDEMMEAYPHLAKTVVNEDIEPETEEPTTEAPEVTEPETGTKPTPEKPDIDETTTEEEKETITDVEIPNTDGFQPNSVVIALAVCGVALGATAVVVKKKED